jgi:hypothetical protein
MSTFLFSLVIMITAVSAAFMACWLMGDDDDF